MSAIPGTRWSLQGRLVVQLFVVFVALAVALYLSVRALAAGTANAAQDGLLGASAISVAEQLALRDGRPFVALPYSALATLSMTGDERVFYSVRDGAGALVTGYETLHARASLVADEQPVFHTAEMDGEEVRVASLKRRVFGDGAAVDLVVVVAQTRDSYRRVSSDIALAAAGVGAGFLLVAGALGFFAVRRALAPLRLLGEALSRRDLDDFEPIAAPAPAEVRPLLDSLNGFILRLRTTLRTSERFITQAAHRIRTPLSVLSAETELAAREAPAGPMRERLQRVLEATHQTSRVTSQLLGQAMVAYRAESRPRIEVSVQAVVEAAWRDIDAAADRKTVGFTNEVGRDVVLRCDEVAVTEALRNVLDNAVKYCPEFAEIEASAMVEPERVVIVIEDSGPGVPAAERDAVTESFVRGSANRDVGGTGLGLAIVAQVMTAHGGATTLTDARLGGLRVELAFPGGTA